MPPVLVKQLIEAGVHFGHRASRWNPKMRPYIYARQNLIHIIDVRETIRGLLRAKKYLKQVAAGNSLVLFVGTKRQAGETIERESERCGMPYVDHRWTGGMLTNWRTLRRSIERLKQLEAMHTDGTLEKLNKKEALLLSRELTKLNRSLSGIKDLSTLPDALFVIDVGHEYIAVSEAKKLNIPVVGVVDTNCKPDGVDYVIPGNDDAIRAIRLYARTAGDAILEGRQSLPTLAAGDDEDFIEVKDEPKVKVAARKKLAVKVDAPAATEGEAEVDKPAATPRPKAAAGRGKPRTGKSE